MKKLQKEIRDLATIKSYLPHREPMILIDAIINIDDQSAITELKIKEEMMFVKESFFLESGILEHMAQTAAASVGIRFSNKGSTPRMGYIAAIHSSEFFSLPKVSETLRSDMNLLFESKELCKVEIKSFVKERPIAVCTMTTLLNPLK